MNRKARKDYVCVWCNQEIKKGSEYYDESPVHLRPYRFHWDCEAERLANNDMLMIN